MSETRTTGAMPLDPDEAEKLIPTHITTREELNRLEQENIVEALQRLKTSRPKSILDETFIHANPGRTMKIEYRLFVFHDPAFVGGNLRSIG